MYPNICVVFYLAIETGTHLGSDVSKSMCLTQCVLIGGLVVNIVIVNNSLP